LSAVWDASVAVLAAMDERHDPRSATARRVRSLVHGYYGLVAPALMAWEVGNVVHIKLAKRFGRSAEARSNLVDAMLDDIQFARTTPPSWRATARIAERCGLSFYDAAYVEVAARDDVSFVVTEDLRLARAAERLLGKGRAYTTQGVAQALDAAEL
jgi:predicted nucleic acid-binding protein